MRASVERHVTGRGTTFPAASYTVALSDTRSPRRSGDGGAVITTVAARTLTTVTVAFPRMPSHVALMVAWPCARAVSTPVLDTVATAGSLDFHSTVRTWSSSAARALRTTPRSAAVLPT